MKPKKVRVIQHDDVPGWWAFTYDPDKKAFRFLIHKTAQQHAEKNPVPGWLVELLQKNYGLGEEFFDQYVPALGDQFGFGGAIKKIDEKPDFVIYEAVMPRIVGGLHAKCDWKVLYPVLASIQLLAKLLDQDIEIESSSFDQPIRLVLGTIIGRSGMGIGGALSAGFAHAVCVILNKDDYRKSVKIAMAELHVHIADADLKKVEDYVHQMGVASEEDGRFCLKAAGSDAHTLQTDSLRTGEGTKLSDHNLDGPLHQLTLLAGLGMILGKYMKSLGIDF